MLVLNSQLITGFVTTVTRRVSLVEQELPTLPERLSSPSVFCGVRVARSLVFCLVLWRSLFVLLSFFLLAIVLFVLLRFTGSDYPFGVFKLFLFIWPFPICFIAYHFQIFKVNRVYVCLCSKVCFPFSGIVKPVSIHLRNYEIK